MSGEDMIEVIDTLTGYSEDGSVVLQVPDVLPTDLVLVWAQVINTATEPVATGLSRAQWREYAGPVWRCVGVAEPNATLKLTAVTGAKILAEVAVVRGATIEPRFYPAQGVARANTIYFGNRDSESAPHIPGVEQIVRRSDTSYGAMIGLTRNTAQLPEGLGYKHCVPLVPSYWVNNSQPLDTSIGSVWWIDGGVGRVVVPETTEEDTIQVIAYRIGAEPEIESEGFSAFPTRPSSNIYVSMYSSTNAMQPERVVRADKDTLLVAVVTRPRVTEDTSDDHLEQYIVSVTNQDGALLPNPRYAPVYNVEGVGIHVTIGVDTHAGAVPENDDAIGRVRIVRMPRFKNGGAPIVVSHNGSYVPASVMSC